MAQQKKMKVTVIQGHIDKTYGLILQLAKIIKITDVCQATFQTKCKKHIKVY